MTTRAVVLARGLGTRMRADDPSAPLTREQRRAADEGRKAMLPIAGRPFLDYVLGALADAGVRRVALVVPPDHDSFARHYGGNGAPARLTLEFVVQTQPLGTADAVLAVERWAEHEPFLTMNSDNLYPAEVLAELSALDEPGLPAFERGELARSGNIPDARVQSFALLEVSDRGYLTGIVEKPSREVFTRKGEGALVSMNCWRFDHRIFDACRDVAKSPRGEFELPLAVDLAVRRGTPFRVVPARGPVLDVSTRADAAAVTRLLEAVTPRL